ncbi:MAG: MFS transporter, partial [Eubacteriales bacterium]
IKNIPRDEKTKSIPFDIAGSVLVFIALLFILLPLSLSGDYSMPTVLLASLILIGIAIAVLFVIYEKKRRNPMLNVGLFKNRVFAASNLAALLTYMAQFVMVFIAPFYLENLRQFSALASGLLYMPMPLATMCIAPISGILSDKFDSRYLSAAGNLVMAAGLFLLSFLDVNTSLAYIIIAMVITGLGFGMFQTPNNSAIMGNVPPENRGSASGALATMRNIGMAVGGAISGALFSFFQSQGNGIFASQGQAGVLLQNNAFTYGLHITFIAAAVVSVLAMVASLNKGKMKVEIVREGVVDS